MFGVAQHQRIGVDLERRDRTLNVEGVARKFMTPREQAALAVLEPDARRRALLRLWTCKEAMSKATGDALSAPFRRIDVELGPPVAACRRAAAVHARRLAGGGRRGARRVSGHRGALARRVRPSLQRAGTPAEYSVCSAAGFAYFHFFCSQSQSSGLSMIASSRWRA